MRHFFYIILLFSGLIFSASAFAQTPTDALMMDAGQICIAATYTHDTWDEYWEGELKRVNGNIGVLKRETLMPMFALGITDQINVIAALPLMRTEASGGQMAGVSGVQDFGLWIKARAFRQNAGPGAVSGHAVLGLTLPASNYLSDYMPLSLGLGCPDASVRGILEYRMDKGPLLRVQAGYQYRGVTTIERTYYYTTQGFYTNQVDVPNALSYSAVLGSWLFHNTLRIEASYDGLKTLGGFDIRRQDMGFPSNRMIFTRVGGSAQYYLPFLKGVGLLASGGYVLKGRNVGQSAQIGGGFTWQFGLWN
ncbi:MAG: transporter [Bacteroidetes bacterium]|nr:MAG: transporter [Bacteroidota bacterium]